MDDTRDFMSTCSLVIVYTRQSQVIPIPADAPSATIPRHVYPLAELPHVSRRWIAPGVCDLDPWLHVTLLLIPLLHTSLANHRWLCSPVSAGV